MNVVEVQSQTVTTEYNGWSNRETWIVNLWLGGDYRYNEQLSEIVCSRRSLTIQAEALENLVRFECDGEGEYPSILVDLVNHSLAGVNWYEIVEKNQE